MKIIPSNPTPIRIFTLLLKRDLSYFCQRLPDVFCNNLIWMILTLLVKNAVLPFFGLSAEYSMFIFVGMITSLGGWQATFDAIAFVADLEGDRKVSFDLTLPTPYWIIFLERATLVLITALLITFVSMIACKLLLWHAVDFSKLSLSYLLIAGIAINSMFGCMMLWLISFVKDVASADNVWIRIVFPLWFLGGFEFSWAALHTMIPYAAYAVLINPYIYATESMRVAFFGQEGYLPFWLSIGILIGFAVIFFWRGIVLLKRRLDLV